MDSASAFCWGMWTGSAVEFVGSAVDTINRPDHSSVPLFISAGIMCCAAGAYLALAGFKKAHKPEGRPRQVPPAEPR
jgi:hypothetical protein